MHHFDCYFLQTPGPPFIPDEAGKGVKARIIFVQHGATLSSEDNLLMGARDEEPSTLGEMQANKAAELLMDLQVSFFFFLVFSFFFFFLLFLHCCGDSLPPSHWSCWCFLVCSSLCRCLVYLLYLLHECWCLVWEMQHICRDASQVVITQADRVHFIFPIMLSGAGAICHFPNPYLMVFSVSGSPCTSQNIFWFVRDLTWLLQETSMSTAGCVVQTYCWGAHAWPRYVLSSKWAQEKHNLASFV